ncbi:MAG: hypothetical protein K8R60_20230 [Burkholderiales bacterium]|nr:hypothetical protein [Burkholderiales bacterium]
MATLMHTEEQNERHLISRLDAAEQMTLRQLTHARAVLARASLPHDDSVLLGAVLQAIVANMPPEGDGPT